MMFRTFFALTVVGGIALWTQAGSEPVAGWIAQGKALIAQVRDDTPAGRPAAATAAAAGSAAGVSSSGPPAAGAMRKCLHQGKVLYTAQACPAGSVEQAVDGAVSVLPDSREAIAAARAASAAATTSASGAPASAVGLGAEGKAAPKNALREKLLGPDDPEMRSRAIDRVVNQ